MTVQPRIREPAAEAPALPALFDEALALALAGHGAARIGDVLRERHGTEPAAALERLQAGGTLARVAALHARLAKYEGLFELLLEYFAAAPYEAVAEPGGLTRARFAADYFHAGRPVVARGATAHWPAAGWSFASLCERYGEQTVQYTLGEVREFRSAESLRQAVRDVRFGEFLDFACGAIGSNERYIVANNGALRRTGLAGLLDDVEPLPVFSDAPAHWHDWVQFWCGPRGTITALHHDGQDVLFTQVLGRKRFKLYPAIAAPWLANDAAHSSRIDPLAVPDELAPRFAELPVLDVTVGPGDLLFIPAGWWHWVYALEPSVSVSFYGFSLDGTVHRWRDCTLPEPAR